MSPNHRWVTLCQGALIWQCWWMLASPHALPIPCMLWQANLQCLQVTELHKYLRKEPRGRKCPCSTSIISLSQKSTHMSVPFNQLPTEALRPLRVVYVLPRVFSPKWAKLPLFCHEQLGQVTQQKAPAANSKEQAGEGQFHFRQKQQDIFGDTNSPSLLLTHPKALWPIAHAVSGSICLSLESALSLLFT